MMCDIVCMGHNHTWDPLVSPTCKGWVHTDPSLFKTGSEGSMSGVTSQSQEHAWLGQLQEWLMMLHLAANNPSILICSTLRASPMAQTLGGGIASGTLAGKWPRFSPTKAFECGSLVESSISLVRTR